MSTPVGIDLNSDLGEGAGNDARIMPFISSANVACGAHAGDEATMRETIALALRHGVAVGAHPGYRDPANFGRLPVSMPRAALVAEVRSQVEALLEVANALGARVGHVKAHGALYNRAERDDEVADAIVQAVRAVDRALVLFAPPASAMERAARAAGLAVAREGFVDRAYEPDGTLRSRQLPASVHDDPRIAAAQALAIAREGGVRTSDGSFLKLAADTLCLHGDRPAAPAIAEAVRHALDAAGVEVRGATPPSPPKAGGRA